MDPAELIEARTKTLETLTKAVETQSLAMIQMAAAVQMTATRHDALEQIRIQKLNEVLLGIQLIVAKLETRRTAL
jgi:hypothetical protein